MISDHGAAGPGQLTSVSTFHWGQQRRNSGYQMSPGYAYVTPTSTADPTITTIMITKLSVLMSLNVCLSCNFPLTPSLRCPLHSVQVMTVQLYSAQYTHWGRLWVSKNSLRSIIPLSLISLGSQVSSSPSIIWLGNVTRTQNISTPKCFIIVMLSSWGL